MTLRMKRGDLLPLGEVPITDPVATFESVASWRWIATQDSEVVIDDTDPTVVADDGVDPHTATVTHVWIAGETDTVGNMNVEVEATWPDGSVQTFPYLGYLRVSIGQDLA